MVTLGRLHVVTDTRPGRDPLSTVRAALDAGAPVVQVRAKDRTDAELYDLACRVAELCAAHDAVCVVNDRPDVALAVDAGGVHVGDRDLPVAAARRVLGPDRVLGRPPARSTPPSATRPPARRTSAWGRRTPRPRRPACRRRSDPAGGRRRRPAVAIPVVVVAAMTPRPGSRRCWPRAWTVSRAISAVSDADDPGRATEALLRAIDGAVPR